MADAPHADSTVLLVSCPDSAGIVAAVTAFVRDHGGNLLHSDQHTDEATDTFYMRVEWSGGDPATVAQEFAPVAAAHRMRWELRRPSERQRVALLVTKTSHCLWDLLTRHQAGELPMDVACVVGNHETLRHVAETFGVTFHHVPTPRPSDPSPEARAAQKALNEAALHDVLKAERADLIVLARYMQVLSPEFVAAYPRRIINVHHSFLPAFVGARPYHRAHARGVKIIGATAHYVTDDLDEGPIIEQVVERVSHRDSVADLIRRGRDLERMALARAIRFHLQSRVLVYGNKTAVFS